MGKVTKLHPYDTLPGMARLNGIPVHKSEMVTKQVSCSEDLPWHKWKIKLSWPPRLIRTKHWMRNEPSVWIVNSVDFGHRIMVHPDLYEDLMGEVIRLLNDPNEKPPYSDPENR